MSTTLRKGGRRSPAGHPDAPPRARRRWSAQKLFDDKLLPLLLVAPAVVVIAGLVGYPVIRTAVLSFTDAAGLSALTGGEINFVGLAQYREIIGDPILRRSAIVTVVFGLACVAGTMLVGIAVALLLNRKFHGRGVLAVLVLLPWAIPHVAASYVYKWLFNDQYGILNWALTQLPGVDFTGFAWFNRWYTAFIVIGLVVIWQSFPFVSIALLAGLQTVPSEVIDAAKVDGASAWQQLLLIRLPMLKPLLLVLVVISTIWNFKIFDQVWVLTEGGPARQSEILAISVYREAILQLDFGLGSALAMVLFTILILFTVVYVRMAREEQP
ncbi:sugar ABC transporter permease [Natronosporangium hydrolyticum]|uniref:Sugar ABC transporter permease n=1 Tax=Natronosporangium hydrolyticum TaxID=2811111 RepID=A0A895YR58_9ACTN|nr:sugar ABC transporter permease [Natronosporangium hydrolyticum]QSB16498.1 sugar ABC transporter permease [Natronosporangium hydrolyticum]